VAVAQQVRKLSLGRLGQYAHNVLSALLAGLGMQSRLVEEAALPQVVIVSWTSGLPEGCTRSTGQSGKVAYTFSGYRIPEFGNPPKARKGRARCHIDREVAQLGSAPALGAGGRGFKSRLPDESSTEPVGGITAPMRPRCSRSGADRQPERGDDVGGRQWLREQETLGEVALEGP
jgi:hypothetical protein